MAQWVKDPVLSLLWRRFDPWPGNFCVPTAGQKKKKKKKKKRERERREKKNPSQNKSKK